ncbi:MAG TPA: GGDEF domain-containing protein, partial [Desulfurivibrionaceae bacterium]|nr:GGDEF domain-containing protein [Desulfurivibrionaceae bacterium]
LTGLPNRRLFLARLEQEVKHARRQKRPLALMFLDLDGFKEVNDSLGHDAGDRVLCDVAARLADCVREDDAIARLGGDEFTVILTNIRQRKDVERLAQTIIDALALPFNIATSPVKISVSIGITCFPDDALAPVDLLATADQAMYKAKGAGANRLWFYDTAENPAAADTASTSS